MPNGMVTAEAEAERPPSDHEVAPAPQSESDTAQDPEQQLQDLRVMITQPWPCDCE